MIDVPWILLMKGWGYLRTAWSTAKQSARWAGGRFLKIRSDQRTSQYRDGMKFIQQNRGKVTGFLRDYYRPSAGLSSGFEMLAYEGRGIGGVSLPLVSKKSYLLQPGGDLQICGRFNPDASCAGAYLEKKLKPAIPWVEARLNEFGVVTWDDPTYGLYRIEAEEDSKNVQLNIEFGRLSLNTPKGSHSFALYRATNGWVYDELALGAARSNYSLNRLWGRRAQLLKARKRYFPSLEELRQFEEGNERFVCAGGIVTLTAIQTDKSEDVALILHSRAKNVSDEAGSLTVIPRAFHQFASDPEESADPNLTVFRECYEELLKGEKRPNEKVKRASERFFKESPATRALYEGWEKGVVILQPLGIVWDLLRGNYHIGYCLYVKDQGAWWSEHEHELGLNWEFAQDPKKERKKEEPILYKASRPERLTPKIDNPEIWAPESYFVFIEGLRWLAQRNKHIRQLEKNLPELTLTSI